MTTDHPVQEARPPARPCPGPKRSIPFELEEDYRDPPPRGFKQADVEFIWWTVASRMSKRQIRAWLVNMLENERAGLRFDSFIYSWIADGSGRGRYPRGVVTALRQVLRPRGLMPRHPRGEVYLIEPGAWHFLSIAALDLCPRRALPVHLGRKKLELDMGMY